MGQQQLRIVDQITVLSEVPRPKTSRGPHHRVEVVMDHEPLSTQPSSPHHASIPDSETPHICRDLAREVVTALLKTVVTNLTLLETGGSSFFSSPFPDHPTSANNRKPQIFFPPLDIILEGYRRSPPRMFIRRKILQPDSGRVHINHRHISEWMVYPPHPMNTGPNRRLHRTVASAYDKQTLIHPSLFGFAVRWCGDNDPVTESRYIHPVFVGRALNKFTPDPVNIKGHLVETFSAQRSRNPYVCRPFDFKVLCA